MPKRLCCYMLLLYSTQYSVLVANQDRFDRLQCIYGLGRRWRFKTGTIRHQKYPNVQSCYESMVLCYIMLHLFQSFSNILTLLQIHFLRVLMPPVVEACTDQTYPMHPNASTCAFCGLVSKSNLVLLHARLSLCIPSMRHAGQTTSRHPLLCRAIEH